MQPSRPNPDTRFIGIPSIHLLMGLIMTKSMFSIFIATFVSLALLAFGASSALADDWTSYRGPNQNGSSNEVGWSARFPKAGPKVLWRANVGTGASSVTVKGKLLLTMGNTNSKDIVSCLDAETGKKIWTFDYPNRFSSRMFDGGTASTPTIDGDFVYTFGDLGDLFCLRLKDGKKVWTRNARSDFGGTLGRWNYSCSPMIDGNLVIIDSGGRDYSTVALNKKNGAPYWGAGGDRGSYSTPVMLERDGKRSVLVHKSSALVALNIEDGQELWRVAWTNRNGVHASSPLIIGDTMFISSGYRKGGALYDLKANPPKQLWFNSDASTKTSSCVTYKGYIFGISEGGVLFCIDIKDGKTIWKESRMGMGALCLSDGKLIVLSQTGELIIAEATSQGFKSISRAEVMQGRARCWVMPVLAGGRIYCRSNKGELVCVDVRSAN